MTQTLYLGRRSLKINDFLEAAHTAGSPRVQLDREALHKVEHCRNFVEHLCEKDTPVYGVNTGVGLLSNTHIDLKDQRELQRNLIRSHCVGVGTRLSRIEARLLMLLRAHTLALGHSGVRPVVIELLMEFLNHDITPVIPSEGSVGASGDLAPLSHLALTLMGEGDVLYQGKRLLASIVMKQLELKPLELEAKEGLALINGTQLMMVYAMFALARIQRLARVADIIAACSTEAVRGTTLAFDARLQDLRPYSGQQAVADNLRRLMANSEIAESHKNCGKIQDPYSFRCIPQVHGAAREFIDAVSQIVRTELHSVTDNPILIPADEAVLMGGNFHGAPIAMALDTLALPVAQFASISERRIEKLTNPAFSDLPAFLVKNPGVNSGLMLAQVTAAALVSENKILAHPASVDTIPTSADKEDHVSMGPAAGRKLKKMIDNAERVLAIEAMCARQGLWLLEPLHGGLGVQEAYRRLCAVMPPIEQDRVLSPDIESVRQLLFRTSFVDEVRQTIGKVY